MIKKFLLIVGMLFVSVSAFGANCEYTCVEPHDLNNGLRTFVSKVSGLNFIGTKIGESILKKSISKVVQSDKNLKVNIDSYSARDLKRGIFKSMTISGENVNIEGIYLSYFELKTLCEFNYVEYDKKGDLKFKEDLPMSFDIKMTADDINNSMKSDRYQKVINDVNKLGFGGIRVSSTSVSIRGNKFYYVVNIAIPFVKEKKIEITADINVKNGKIDFENTRLTSSSFKLDLKKIDFIMNYLNPLDFSVYIFDNKDAKVYIKNIAIKNNVITTDGIIVVQKD
ncbi:hypothetical protein J6G99_02040 [bacterium]|nr:hypothetical protein [bacterium]